jgi:hypothetical protein
MYTIHKKEEQENARQGDYLWILLDWILEIYRSTPYYYKGRTYIHT